MAPEGKPAKQAREVASGQNRQERKQDIRKSVGNRGIHRVLALTPALIGGFDTPPGWLHTSGGRGPPPPAQQEHGSVEYLRTLGGLGQETSPAKQYGMKLHVATNAKVSGGSQPPVTHDLYLSETAGSREIPRLFRRGPSLPCLL